MTAFARICTTTLVCTAVVFATALPAVAQVTGTQPTTQTTRSGQFDFVDADIRSVITAVASAGDLNVVFGDIPAKTVSLRTRMPTNRDEYLALLRSVANANGLRISEDGDLITIASVAPPQQRQQTGAIDPLENTQMFVYRLKHASAAQMAGVLQAIFSGGSLPTTQNRQTFNRQGNNSRNSQNGGFGGGGNEGGFGGSGFNMGGGGGFANIIGGAFGGQGGAQAGRAKQVIIVPEEATNTLLIRADSADWNLIRQAIAAVDLRPLQVLIEVMIVEVRRSDDLKAGVSVTGSNERTTSGRTEARGGLRSLLDTTAGLFLDLTRYGTVDINVALSALQSRGNVSIKSLPLLFAQNNQESRLLVGSQRPFIQTFRTLATDNSARDQVVQYRDVGTSLAILPTINQDGYVNLLVQQEVSSATNEIQFGAPVISTREAATAMFVKDGQTIVVGGLTDQQEEKIRSGIPGLSRIPGLGVLFSSTQKTKVRTELFLFLTPHIVQIDADIERIRNEIKSKAPLLQTIPTTPLITSPMDSTAPKYPTIEEPGQKQQRVPARQQPRQPTGGNIPFPVEPASPTTPPAASPTTLPPTVPPQAPSQPVLPPPTPSPAAPGFHQSSSSDQ